MNDESVLNYSHLDMSLNLNSSIYHDASGTTQHSTTPSAVNPQEMVWEANIHPRYGIRREVLFYKSGFTNARQLKTAHLHVGSISSRNGSRSNDLDDALSSVSSAAATPLKRVGDAARVVGRAIQLPRIAMSGKRGDVGKPSSASVGGDNEGTPSFHVAYRRRLPDEEDIPALADVRIMYLQLPVSCIPDFAAAPGSYSNKVSNGMDRCREKRGLSGLLRNGTGRPDSPWNSVSLENNQVKIHAAEQQEVAVPGEPTENHPRTLVPLRDVLQVPNGFDEVILPSFLESFEIDRSVSCHSSHRRAIPKIVVMFPAGVSIESRDSSEVAVNSDDNLYIPLLVTRRVRTGEEERWHEDPGIVDLCISYLDGNGDISVDLETITEVDDEDDEFNDSGDR